MRAERQVTGGGRGEGAGLAGAQVVFIDRARPATRGRAARAPAWRCRR
jgi:hypothetical protein